MNAAPTLSGPRLLFVPSGLPEPEEPTADTSAVVAVEEVAGQVPGLTLVVSHRRRLLDAIGERGHRRIGRGAGHGRSLPRNGVQTLLLCDPDHAADTLAQRVLSCLVVDRLPLPRARTTFVQELPESVARFREIAGIIEGAGENPGLLVVLDPRLVTSPYGRWFLAALPPMPRSRRLDDVPAFFAPAPALRRAS